MTGTWAIAALWLGLALLAALLSIWFRTATALSEIVVGTLAQWVAGVTLGASLLPADTPWITFLASAGAIMLTFLAGSVFGLFWGTMLVSVTSTIAATLEFLAARYVLRDARQSRFSSNVLAFNAG